MVNNYNKMWSKIFETITVVVIFWGVFETPLKCAAQIIPPAFPEGYSASNRWPYNGNNVFQSQRMPQQNMQFQNFARHPTSRNEHAKMMDMQNDFQRYQDNLRRQENAQAMNFIAGKRTMNNELARLMNIHNNLQSSRNTHGLRPQNAQLQKLIAAHQNEIVQNNPMPQQNARLQNLITKHQNQMDNEHARMRDLHNNFLQNDPIAQQNAEIQTFITNQENQVDKEHARLRDTHNKFFQKEMMAQQNTALQNMIAMSNANVRKRRHKWKLVPNKDFEFVNINFDEPLDLPPFTLDHNYEDKMIGIHEESDDSLTFNTLDDHTITSTTAREGAIATTTPRHFTTTPDINRFSFVKDYEDDDFLYASDPLNPRINDEELHKDSTTPRPQRTFLFPFTEFVDPRVNVSRKNGVLPQVTVRFPLREFVNVTAKNRFGSLEEEDDYYVDDESSEHSHTIPLELLNNKTIPIECKYNTTEYPIPKMNITKQGRRVSDIKCQEYEWRLKYEIVLAKKNEMICNKKTKVSGVTGGRYADQGEFPHMGALGWLRKKDLPIWFCGCSLISPRFTITAAHCRTLENKPKIIAKYNLKHAKPKVVLIGAVDLNKMKGIRKEFNIEKFIVHEEYVQSKYYNDIALVRLDVEVPMAGNLRPACLWPGVINKPSGIVTGWGQTKHGDENSLQTKLKSAKIEFIEKEQCKDLLKNDLDKTFDKGLIHSQFCAGNLSGGTDSCQGDSGGPVQVQSSVPDMESKRSMYHLVGIVCAGSGCGKRNLPGIYTNISSYLCWIERTVWPEEDNSYCDIK